MWRLVTFARHITSQHGHDRLRFFVSTMWSFEDLAVVFFLMHASIYSVCEDTSYEGHCYERRVPLASAACFSHVRLYYFTPLILFLKIFVQTKVHTSDHEEQMVMAWGMQA